MKKETIDLKSWGLLILLALIWGSSFILMKLGMETFPDDQVASLRLVFALLFVIPLWFFYLKRKHLRYWKFFLVSAVFGNLLPAFLFTYAETEMSSSQAGMLNSFTPIATLLLGWGFWKAQPGRNGIWGALIGLAGTSGLFLFSEHSGNSSLIYSAAVLLATLMYGLSVNVIRNHLQDVDAITITVWSMTFCGVPALIYLSGTNFPTLYNSVKGAGMSLFYIGILGVIGSSVSVIFFNKLIHRSNALFASSVTYLIPIVSVLWGLAFKEVITLGQIFSMLLILSGIWVMNKK